MLRTAAPPIETDAACKPVGEVPADLAVYLQLPSQITQRTCDKAKEITRNAKTTYDKAVAIKQWLAATATYTLELKEPGTQEPVDFFLFDRKEGHCEYFASGFAILARAAGIPTRQVNGFLGGEWNEYQGYIAVRAGDAHSWDEVLFVGDRTDDKARKADRLDNTSVWVTFDPTPPGDVDQLGRGGDGWRAKMSRFIDTLRFQWTKWVIEYDLVSQLSLFKSIGRALKAAAIWLKDGVLWIVDLAVDYWPISSVLGGGLLALYLARRRKKRRNQKPAEGRLVKPRKRSSVAEIYDGVAKQLAKAGFSRATGTTPRELAAKLVERGDPAAEQVAQLVDIYYAAEWGGRRDAASEDRAEALAVEIKHRLIAARKRKAA
jgi:protein-glutamine gamma-glutamyltransferase